MLASARVVVERAGLSGVRIEPHEGFPTDHYDPRTKVLRWCP